MYWVDLKCYKVQIRYVINNRDKELLKRFGEHLRTIRKNAGLSQQELELKAEISKNQVGNIERGEVNITLVTATRISQALKMSLSDLFNLEV
jgi:transcriptional regulator with XRE-family HTH domain